MCSMEQSLPVEEGLPAHPRTELEKPVGDEHGRGHRIAAAWEGTAGGGTGSSSGFDDRGLPSDRHHAR